MFHGMQDDERFVGSVIFSGKPTTGRSGAAKAHVSPWDMFLTPEDRGGGRERERERERGKLGGGSERHYRLEGGVTET
jgi:hypothetical protein